MKLWKRTVLLMLVTLLCALIPVGTLSLYITGKRSLNNAAETYGRQLENGKVLLEQFWDNSKYEQMSETGKRAYMGFQFRRCCGEGMALIDRKSNAVIENLTDYKVVGLENLGLKDEGNPYAYKIQKLGQKYLLLQMEPLSRPEGYEVLSVREVTGLFCRAETDRCLVFGNLSGCVPDRRPFYLYDDAKNCGTDGETTGSGRETGAAHGGTFP